MDGSGRVGLGTHVLRNKEAIRKKIQEASEHRSF